MKTIRRETFIDHGFGFPVVMNNAPFATVLGEDNVLNVDVHTLTERVFAELLKRRRTLTEDQLRFIINYFRAWPGEEISEPVEIDLSDIS